MPVLTSIAIGCAAAGIVGGQRLIKRPKTKLVDGLINLNDDVNDPKNKLVNRINALSDNQQPKKILENKVNQLITTIKPTLVEVDTNYQLFVREYIDPLLGHKRQNLINLLADDNENRLIVSPVERVANHRLAIGGLALVSSGLGYIISPLFTNVAIGLGLLTAYYLFEGAYKSWKATHKLGAVHLICVYLAFLWLGGYATIGALGVVFISLGMKIEAITEGQSRNNLLTLFQIQPDTVWIRHADGLEISIPFDQLQIGDTIVLQAGQTVPVDGVIISGEATIDQHMLTGEAQPVEKTVNELVLASTVVLSGKVDVRVEKSGLDTTAGQIVDLLNEATNYNSAQSFKAVEMADKLAWPTLGLSVLSGPFIGVAGAVALLRSNMTLTTWITNPLVMLNFFNITAENGVLIKDGAGLDRMVDVDTIVFDKTGTLTLDELKIAQLHPLTSISADELLRLAAIAEGRQTHPIARAILNAAQSQQLELPPVDQVHYEVGYGLKVTLPEGEVRLGSQRFMVMENIPIPEEVEHLKSQSQATGHSLVMVALDDQLVGCIELAPMVRSESERVITALREQDLSLYIISGDQEPPTRKLAESLGMTGYFANTLPEQKADLVAKLQEEGRSVCFIGDGINDALAMRQADVSISLRGATSVATDTAQIVLMDGDLKQLPNLFKIGQAFGQNVKTNFNFSVVTSLCTAGTILFTGLTLGATPLFASLAFSLSQFFAVFTMGGGLWIAMNPRLEHQHNPVLIEGETNGYISKEKIPYFKR